MAPSTKSKSTSTSLKQATLGFITSKRTSSAAGIGKGKKPIRTRSTPVTRDNAVIDIENSSQEDSVDDIQLTSSEEEAAQKHEDSDNQKQGFKEGRAPPAKTSNKQKGVKSSDKVGMFRSRDGVENSNGGLGVAGKTGAGVERVDLDDNDPRWRKHHAAVREKMGKLQPIHAQGQNKIHEILRIFDLSYEYGPCIGVTRLERWERANALGLNPPNEVREILSTKPGMDQTEFSQSVFYDEV